MFTVIRLAVLLVPVMVTLGRVPEGQLRNECSLCQDHTSFLSGSVYSTILVNMALLEVWMMF